MAEKKETAKEIIKTKQTSLPSIQQLFKDAWKLFKKTTVLYLQLVGLGIAYFLLVILVGVLIALPVIFTAIGSHFQLFSLTPFSVISLVLLGLWVIFYIISLFALSIVFPIISIFILEGKKEKIIDLVKQSKKFFWAYFLTALLAGLFIVGGTSLLLIPGLLIAFFFAFVAFEVVVDSQSGINALKRSYFMVKNNFWELLGRILLLEAITIIISSLLGSLAMRDWGLRFIQFLFGFFASWYARAYMFLLYTQVRERTTFPEKISIRWIWIVSEVGWVVIILLSITLGYVLTHLPSLQPHNLHRIPKGAV